MSRELFTGDVHGREVKHISVATKFRPKDDTFEVETESWSDSEGESDGSSMSDTHTSGSTQSQSTLFGEDGFSTDPVGSGSGTSQNHSIGHSTSSTRSTQHSHSSGGSRTVVPITRHEEFQEETSRTFVSLEEQFEARTARVHGLGKREALIRVHNGPVLHIRTPDVEHSSDQRSVERFRGKVVEQCEYIRPAAEVIQEIQERRKRLQQAIRDAAEAGRPLDVKTFRS